MKWEYNYLYIDSNLSDKANKLQITEELNKLGQEGWELVNFVSIFAGFRYAFIFKRPKE